MDGEIIPFYSCFSDYTQQEDKTCFWTSEKLGEQFDSLEEAKTGCTNLPGCSMFSEEFNIFFSCPVGSTVVKYYGGTLYTATGKLS